MRFYASLILLLWFMHAWFDDLFADDPSGSLWKYVNVLFVAVSLSSGPATVAGRRRGGIAFHRLSVLRRLAY